VPENRRFEIWDSHVHILPPGRTKGLVRWIKKAFPAHPSREDMTPEDVLADLRACGVEKVFNLVFPLKDPETEALNLWSRDIAARYQEVVPFGSMHIDTARKEEVAERCLLEYGLAGIKLHPYVQGFEAFSEPFEPLFRKLQGLRRPFIVHTGFDAFYRRSADLGYLQGMLERYPEMPVVLVHAVFPKFKLVHRLMSAHGQLYLDLTNVISAVRYYSGASPGVLPPDAPVDLDELSANIDYFYRLLDDYSDRIMFGTDHPAGMGSPRQIYDDFDSFGFSTEISSNLLGGTARRFLKQHCGQ